jgi:hypothetical protein
MAIRFQELIVPPWTEALTLIAQNHVTDELYEQTRPQFANRSWSILRSRQSSTLALGVIWRFSPSHQAVEQLFAFAGCRRVFGMHVDAISTAVDLICEARSLINSRSDGSKAIARDQKLASRTLRYPATRL